MSELIIQKKLKDWRQRLHHRHPDFKPGFILVDGIEAFYVDEEGREFLTAAGTKYIQTADSFLGEIDERAKKEEKKKALVGRRYKTNSKSNK